VTGRHDLADLELLRKISAELIEQEDVEGLYEKILDAGVAIMRSDCASMQMLYPERGKAGELLLLAFRGFDPEAARFWHWVRADSDCTCGIALRTRDRFIEPDVAGSAAMAGTADQAALLRAGILAAQSTPLRSRAGEIVGMISTHWTRPHRPSERDLLLLDILARQAADLIERRKAEDTLRANERALRETDRYKDEFLSMISHELRNPLAPIRHAVTLLKEAPDEPELRQHACAVLDRQVDHIARLVDDLTDISRISRGDVSLRKQPVDLSAVIESAVETSRPFIEAGGHQLRVTLPPGALVLEADSGRLVQIVTNLLNNSARFTPSGGRIELKVDGEPGAATISVRDNGIGMKPDALSRVFEMYAQVDTSQPAVRSGMGIGLALARQLVELHGGSIGARSEGPGRGSEFTIRIPVPPRDAAA
jgi:signal transduction histidine kinase